MSDSVRPHGLQPTRLLRPWDFQARVLEWGAIAFSVPLTRSCKKHYLQIELSENCSSSFCISFIGRTERIPENHPSPVDYVTVHACLHVQSCLALCNSVDCSPPHSSGPYDFPGKNTGVGCQFLLQGDLPYPGIEPESPVSPELAGGFLITVTPGKHQ